MEINCEFDFHTFYSKKFYTCLIKKVSITKKDRVIKEFKGNHKEGKSHKDVRRVVFRQTNVNYFPRGLGKHFPNLTHLSILRCGIKEISKNDLKGLVGLVSLRISHCKLTSLPGDLLTEIPNLRTVSFDGNKIEFASSDLLKPLIGRENVLVDLRENKNIDACSWPGYGRSLKSLEELMNLIDKKCSEIALSINKQNPEEPALPTIIDPNQMDFNPKLKEMWISGRFSDFIIFAENKEFKVHKNILGMQNEVFAKMFESQNVPEMKLPYFSSQSVEALLKFIYTNEISKDGNATEYFEIADQFKVPEMKSIYEKIICDQINEENAWETFLFAHRFSSQLLKEKSFQQIAQNLKEDLPDELMEDSENLKILIDARRLCETILNQSKKKRLA